MGTASGTFALRPDNLRAGRVTVTRRIDGWINTMEDMMKLGKLFGLIALIFAVALSAPSLAAPDYDAIVVGQNDPLVDVANIQNAMNLGGRILLRGTFDFGFDGFVNVVGDVILEGEKRGGVETTILGGFATLRSEVMANLTVRKIRFEGSRGVAILAPRTTGLTVEESTFVDMHPAAGWGGWVIPAAEGINVGSWTDLGIPEDPRDKVIGDVLIKDNYFRLDLGTGIEEHGHGITVDLANVDLRITGNRLFDTGCTAIVVRDNAGNSMIADNEIEPGLQVANSSLAGNGMLVGAIARLWGLDFDRGSLLVTRNEIRCTNPNADGIALQEIVFDPYVDADTVFSKNHVVMENSLYGALTNYIGGYNAVWMQNKVEGSMAWAMAVFGDDFFGTRAENNTYMANNISLAETTVCDMGFGHRANHNLMIGHCDTLVDLGEGNMVNSAGGSPRHKQMGQDVRDAVHLKNEMLKEARR